MGTVRGEEIGLVKVIMVAPPLIRSKDICRELGIKNPRLSVLIKAGLPVAKKGKGTIGNSFDLDAVRGWMVENMPNDPRVQVAAIEAAKAAGKSLDVINAAAPGPDRANWDQVMDRARRAEQVAFGSWAKALKEKDWLGATSCSRSWREMVKELRLMELDTAKIAEQRGESITRTDHERIYIESHSKVAAELKNLSKQIAQVVIGVKNQAEAYKIIDVEVRQSMRHLARDLGINGSGKDGKI